MDKNFKILTVLSCFKLTCLQINPETEVACNYPKPIFQDTKFRISRQIRKKLPHENRKNNY